MPTPRPSPSAPHTGTTTAIAAALAVSVGATSIAARPADAQPAINAPAAAGPVAVRGAVYDSLSRGPLAGAIVQAVRVDNPASARTTSTDSTGGFQLDSLTPGRYLLGFLHPTLDMLAVQITPVVLVVDGRPLPPVVLAVPGPTTVRAAVCPATPPTDSTGAVAGVVRNAMTGDPAGGATVVFSWQEIGVTRQGLQREARRVPTTVRPDGSFLVCGVPTDGPIEASASAPGATSGLVEVAALPRGLIVQRFALGPVAAPTAGRAGGAAADSADDAERGGLPRPAPGTARLVGRVVGPDAQAVNGARVRVWGTDASAATGTDGRYTLTDLPSGTFTVEVRGIGLEPSRTPVDLANGQTAELRIALAKAVPKLDRVTVLGTPTEHSRFLEEFEARRRSGQGRYYTAADIAARHALELTDVIRGTPSINVIPRGAHGNVLRGRRGCTPTVWVDGSLVRGGANNVDDLVPAQGVEAIEVYGSGAILPAQYNMTGTGGSFIGGATCGAVLIWTLR